MTIETRIIQVDSGTKKFEIPVTTDWKGERMIRNQSIRATVKEIVRRSESLDLVKINLIGEQSSGKTTLALTLSHLIHKMSKIPFAIKVLDEDDLLNIEGTLKNLIPTNYVLIFDDVSFLSASASKKQIEKVKQVFTKIRHLPGGQDVKIITIFNFHYQLGLDKYLRMSHFFYYTNVGSSELENMQKTVGVKYTTKIREFQKIYYDATTYKKFSFKLGKKGKFFTYSYRHPFIPLLFYNNSSLRFVVSPKREWVDSICSICAASKNTPMKDGINVDDFANDLSHKFGVSIARSAVRIKLFQNGMNVYPKRIKQAMQYIDKYIENKIMNLQELADFYDFKNDPTRLDEKIP